MEGSFGTTEQILLTVSVFSSIIMCKVAYEITRLVSSLYFKGYGHLNKSKQIEWNNRGISTFHAIVVIASSTYLLLVSDLFKDGAHKDSLIDRRSMMSNALFGISLGYFLVDLGMILWLFPSLGGKEYILHHGLSMFSIFLSLLSGKAQFYILIILFSEVTTPFVNLRWYLDLAGQRSSNLYVYNGVALFLGWLVARILLFIYLFVHMYLHFDQVKTIFPLGFYCILVVPSMLALMNAFWFWKILKGMAKTLSKKAHTH